LRADVLFEITDGALAGRIFRGALGAINCCTVILAMHVLGVAGVEAVVESIAISTRSFKPGILILIYKSKNNFNDFAIVFFFFLNF